MKRETLHKNHHFSGLDETGKKQHRAATNSRRHANTINRKASLRHEAEKRNTAWALLSTEQKRNAVKMERGESYRQRVRLGMSVFTSLSRKP